MAQKAAKQQAARNSVVLRRIHLISLSVNIFFILFRFFIFHSSYTRATYLFYLLSLIPSLAIEFWLEKTGRPRYTPNGELKRSGEDLEAKGLTEYLFDIIYWCLGTTFIAGIFGDRAWWMLMVIPLYSVWLAYSVFGSVRQGMKGLSDISDQSKQANDAMSNRQKKSEKRGGQKVQYR